MAAITRRVATQPCSTRRPTPPAFEPCTRTPDFAPRGVGRLVLETCEAAAAAEGFSILELMATRSGRPLYESFGSQPVEEVHDGSGGAPVPLTRMRKHIAATGD